MSVTQITDDNIDSGIDTSKCIGAIGAIDGSALTGLNVGTSLLKYGFNPAVDTNPSDGVGAIWINTATGQMFSCTDATTDQNTWTNMGSGTGHITYTPPWSYQGNISAHTAGGGNPDTKVINKWSFASNVTASNKGNLTSGARHASAGQCSATHGYTSGGWAGFPDTRIDKVGLASSSESAGLPGAALTVGRAYCSGQSSETYGYNMGGHPTVNRIDKFSFASDNSCTTVGNQTTQKHGGAGQSSTNYGYQTGGQFSLVIQKISFVTDGDSTTVGNLTVIGRAVPAGQNSDTHGFTSGGSDGSGSPNRNIIDKFSFASDGDAVDHADLSVSRQGCCGHSSQTHGFASGGSTTDWMGQSNVIDKYSFSSSATATDHGDLTVSVYLTTGHQY